MTTDNDFVAKKLGLWDSARQTECTCDQKYGEPDNFYNEAGNRCHWHKAGPAPDLLANPWLLVAALWKRGAAFAFIQGETDGPYVSIYVPRRGDFFSRHETATKAAIIDGNLATALLQAAAEILRKEK